MRKRGHRIRSNPPDKAKQLITDCHGLIAVASKRNEFGTGAFAMPSAVHDEISIAYGLDTPALLFVEEGVQVDGFINNYGTHLRFSKDSFESSEFLEKAVAAIHNFKMDIIPPQDLMLGHDSGEFFAEYNHSLFELSENAGTFTWIYGYTKKLMFQKPYRRALREGAWATVPSKVPSDAPRIDWDIKVESSSRNIDIHVEKRQHTASSLEALITFEPRPEPNDYIEYSAVVRSPYLNPIYEEDLGDSLPLRLDDGEYHCFDGLIPIQRTKKAYLEFRFPRTYGLQPRDVVPFVGSYTSHIDYAVESELKRASVDKEVVAGALTIRMRIESPLLRHFYGIAWNPKPRPNT